MLENQHEDDNIASEQEEKAENKFGPEEVETDEEDDEGAQSTNENAKG